MVSQSVDRIGEDDLARGGADRAPEVEAGASSNRLAGSSLLLGLACTALFAGLAVWFVVLDRLPPRGWDVIGTALVVAGVLAALAGLVLSTVARRRGERRSFARAGFWLCLATLIFVAALFAQWWMSKPASA